MRLAAPADVLSAQAVRAIQGAEEYAGVALDLTYPVVESLLETSLLYGSYVDYFNRSQYSFSQLRLTNSFVDTDLCTVYALPASSTLALDAAEIIDSSLWHLDPVKGVISSEALSSYGSSYRIAVSYSAGFDSKPAGKPDAQLVGVPDWLRRVGVLAAMQLMTVYPTGVASAKSKKDASAHVYDACARAIRNSIDPFLRPRAGVEWPLYTLSND